MRSESTTNRLERLKPAGWLGWARLAWVVITLVLVGLYIASIPPYYRQLASSPTSTIIQDPKRMLELLAEAGIPPGHYAIYHIAFVIFSISPYLLIGLLLFVRLPKDRSALVISSLLILVATGGGSITQPPGSPHSFTQAVALFFAACGSLSTPLLFYLFPDGRFVPGWTRWLVLLIIPFVFMNVFFASTPLDPSTYPLLDGIYGLLTIGSFLFALIYRYIRSADTIQRQQMKWALLGILATPLTWVLVAVMQALFPAFFQPTIAGLHFGLAYFVWSVPLYLLGPVGIGFSIFRYRLYDIDIIIRRTLLYSSLSVLLGLVYLGGVTVLQTLFAAFSSQQSTISIVITTLIISALFNPLRRGVQEFIDRRFYRRKYDAEQALAQFAAAARSGADLDILSSQMVRVASESLQPVNTEVWYVKKPERVRYDL